MGRNGRLNVWECDTALDGLVKKPKSETIEEIGVDGDELASSQKRVDLNEESDEIKDNAETDAEMEIEVEQKVKVTIHYKKTAK